MTNTYNVTQCPVCGKLLDYVAAQVIMVCGAMDWGKLQVMLDQGMPLRDCAPYFCGNCGTFVEEPHNLKCDCGDYKRQRIL